MAELVDTVDAETHIHRGAIAHAGHIHSDRVGRSMAGHERVVNERHSPACCSEKHPELRTVADLVRRPGALGSETRRHEPVVHAERIQRGTGPSETWLVMNESRLNSIIAQTTVKYA